MRLDYNSSVASAQRIQMPMHLIEELVEGPSDGPTIAASVSRIEQELERLSVPVGIDMSAQQLEDEIDEICDMRGVLARWQCACDTANGTLEVSIETASLVIAIEDALREREVLLDGC